MSDQSHDRRDEGTTVAQAARILGITEGAVRKRVERGKLAAERVTGGRLIVHLDSDTTATDTTATDATRDRLRQSSDERYMRSLEEQVEYLRSQLKQEREARTEERRRQDTVIAQLLQANAEHARTIRELEAPSEPRESPQTVEEEPDRAARPRPDAPGAAQEGVQRPWWRRMFGS
jgi:predicted transcriptional regulator